MSKKPLPWRFHSVAGVSDRAFPARAYIAATIAELALVPPSPCKNGPPVHGVQAITTPV
jgi:hypothetical protein